MQAVKHCTAGLGIWEWASNDRGGEPDVVMACCGDVPTLETLAAVELLREHAPELKVRVINVVDLMTLQPPSEHPHGLSDRDFDALFTTDKPIIFAFHGYPWLIHRLTYRRDRPRQHPRARLQGRGHDHHAVRHVRDQRPRPLPPGRRRDRPRAEARRARRLRQAGDPRQAHRASRNTSAATATTCPRSRTGHGGRAARRRPQARRRATTSERGGQEAAGEA